MTQADLDEQVAFQLKVRDAISDARRLQQQIEEAMKKAGVAGAASGSRRACARPTSSSRIRCKRCGRAWSISRASTRSRCSSASCRTCTRMVGQADQKVGKDAVDRFNDLVKELQSAKTEFQKVGGTM